MISPGEQASSDAHYRAENANLRPSLCAGNPEDIDTHTPKTIDVTAAWQDALAKLAVAEAKIASAIVELKKTLGTNDGYQQNEAIITALNILNEK